MSVCSIMVSVAIGYCRRGEDANVPGGRVPGGERNAPELPLPIIRLRASKCPSTKRNEDDFSRGGAHCLEPRAGGFGDAFPRGMRPCKPKRTVALQTERKIGPVNRVGGASRGAECTMQRMRDAGVVLGVAVAAVFGAEGGAAQEWAGGTTTAAAGPKSVGTVSPKGGAAASNERVQQRQECEERA